MKEEIMERMKERFKDIDIEEYDFTSHTPDGKVTEYKGIMIKFNMSTANSVNPKFFDALIEEGLKMYNVIVAGLYIEFRLYYKKTEIKFSNKETFRAFGENFNKMPIYAIVQENEAWSEDKFMLSLHKTGVYWSDGSDLTKMELLASVMRGLVLNMHRSTIQASAKEKAYRLSYIQGTLEHTASAIGQELKKLV
jgi:hypothetical protein